MPVPATFHNTIFDIRCSKCKKSDDPIYFTENRQVYKTCNECRARARRRYKPRVSITYHDTDDVMGANAVLSLSSSSAADPTIIPMYIDDFDMSDLSSTFAAMYVSVSSPAASTSSADYFVDEPDAEPEP